MTIAKRLRCWTKNIGTNYPARWDEKEGSGVVVVNNVVSRGKPRFEAMYSYATGGWHSIGVEKTKQKAVKKAFGFMEDRDTC